MKFVWRQVAETPQMSVASSASIPAVTEPAATAVTDPAASASPPPPPVGDPATVLPPAGTLIPDPAANQTNCAPNCSSSAALATGSRSEEASQSQSVVISKTASPSPSSNGTIANGNPSTNTQRATDGLSGGTVAGVAIGMFLVGLLIAGAVFFFLLRRQKKKRYIPAPTHLTPHAHNYGAAGQVEKGPTVATSAYASNIDDMLPQPVADDAITGAVLNIRDNIKNHVREFYHVSPVPAASINQASMRELAIATGTSSSVLASMLSNISTRAETLRLIVAWSVLSRCTGERVESLLPGELAPLASAVPGRDGKNAGMFISASGSL
ncbi:hypothetical protein J4E93_004746 [Alternaria ventricosa]|uniref:uncharacterized protein n=1 Tax=Alternaria ventricosa TaxID=1187951 RepID=UPI0020C4015C|nr:uncharacterized protein J4E93_004746 [Alternaria ventricosa]KAI4648334.1 hypothetical protein J4E93_004746 [Alternaria ventricosa]